MHIDGWLGTMLSSAFFPPKTFADADLSSLQLSCVIFTILLGLGEYGKRP